MATHSSVLACKIPGTGSLVGCSPWGCTESDMTEATWQQQQQSRVKGKQQVQHLLAGRNWDPVSYLGLSGSQNLERELYV